jgi:glycosyltransferase involved in cell wall biosynthesis
VTVSVVVPSFGRPGLLAACLRALAAQTHAPDEVLVAARAGDEETVAVAREHGARVVTVRTPGHLPPLRAGVEAASGDVVAFVDDDAEPWPDWLAKLLRHYADPALGGAGGLVAQGDERRASARTGRISRGGRFDALHHERVPVEWGARDVDALRGTNMSFRRALLLAYAWDGRLNGGAATDYEIDLCAHVRRCGCRLVWDPDAVVVHHLGERPELGRRPDAAAIRAYSHNQVYVAGKALPPARAALAVASALLVGNRLSHGLATAVAETLLGRPPSLREQLLPAFAGKAAALRSLRRLARSGPEPLPPA